MMKCTHNTHAHSIPASLSRVQGRVLLILCVLAFFALPSLTKAWFDDDFSYCRSMTMTAGGGSGGVATTTTNGFALVATSTIADLAHSNHSGNVEVLDFAQSPTSTPLDVVFTSGTDCVSDGGLLLDFYFEEYASTTGEFVAYVEVMDISSTTQKTILMYYGNSSATNVQDRTGTWGALGEIGAWNLDDDPTVSAPQMRDSTSGGNNGTVNGTVTSVDGWVNGGVSFSSEISYISLGDPGIAEGLPQFSVGMWVQTDLSAAPNSARLISQFGAGADVFQVLWDTGEDLQFVVKDPVQTTATAEYVGTFLTDNGWHYVTGVYNGANVYIYHDSVPGLTVASLTGITEDVATLPIEFGSSVLQFDIRMDDIRMYANGLHPMDVLTIYNNTKSSGTFWQFGDEETNSGGGGGDPTVTISSLQNQRFSIGDEATTISPITISDVGTPAITTTHDIVVAIATTSGFLMEWDTSITSATITGSASGKVSSTVSYGGASVLFVTVTSDFSSNDSITISGLKYKNFTGPPKSGTGALRLLVEGTTNISAAVQELVTIGLDFSTTLKSPSNYLLRTGLIGHWTFDGPDLIPNVRDKSSQGNHGYVVGQTSTTTAPGKIGQAFSFDGSDDSITLPGITTGTTFTYSVWLKPNSQVDTYGSIFTQGTLRGFFYRGSDAGADNRKISFYYSTDHHNNTALTDNSWNHYVAVVDGGSVTYYLNGVSDGSSSSAVSSDIDTMGNDAGSETYRGLMDDVRLWNRALSASEIGELYRLGTARLR